MHCNVHLQKRTDGRAHRWIFSNRNKLPRRFPIEASIQTYLYFDKGVRCQTTLMQSKVFMGKTETHQILSKEADLTVRWAVST